MLSTGILTGMHVTKHGKPKLTNCYNKILGMHVGFFPLEYAGELHIIALREEELGQNSHTTQTPRHTQNTHHSPRNTGHVVENGNQI